MSTKRKIVWEAPMSVHDRFKDAMTNSLALAERGEHVDALKLLDEAIAEAI